MLTIPHKKIKSREATMSFLLDPARLRTFILELRAYLRSTQHLFQKKGFENDPKQCKHRGMHDRPEPVLFRRFNHFCYERGLDWEGAREMMEVEFSKKLAKRKPLIFGLISRYINYLGQTSQFHLVPSIL